MCEKAQSYVALANLSKELLSDRRKLEWRLAFSLWTAIVVVTYGLMEIYSDAPQGQRLGVGGYWCTVITFLIATLLYSFWWLPLNTGSDRKDMELLSYFRKRTQEELGDLTSNTPTWPKLDAHPWTYGWERWWLFVPLSLFSVALVVLAAIVLWQVRG